MAPKPPLKDFGVPGDTMVSPGTPKSKRLPRQSPVDLGSAVQGDPGDLSIRYYTTVLRGHDGRTTLDFPVQGRSSMTVDGVRYELNGLHFHVPAEHAIDGRLAAAEVHFTHADKDGNIAVLAVPIDESDTSKGPRRLEQPTMMKHVLPESRTRYTYQGSLTTPPFTEGVQWVVLTERVRFHPDWIAAFRERYGKNNRELQPLNGRTITVG